MGFRGNKNFRNFWNVLETVLNHFKCGKTQVQAILLKKDEILKDFESNLNGNIKRLRAPQHEGIDKAFV